MFYYHIELFLSQFLTTWLSKRTQ